MKSIKTLGAAAMAGIALTAIIAAGTAQATVLGSGETLLTAGTTITATLSGSATLTTTEGTVLDTCTGGEVKGKTTNAGGAAETVKGTVEKTGLTWTRCTEPTSTLAGGSLEIHHITGTTNGTLTGSGFEVTVNTTIFGSCIFTLGAGTTLGTLTGSTSGNATMDINAVATRKSGLCPSSAKWVGTYTVTGPSPLKVEGQNWL
jgi:hypothetical protein